MLEDLEIKLPHLTWRDDGCFKSPGTYFIKNNSPLQ